MRGRSTLAPLCPSQSAAGADALQTLRETRPQVWTPAPALEPCPLEDRLPPRHPILRPSPLILPSSSPAKKQRLTGSTRNLGASRESPPRVISPIPTPRPGIARGLRGTFQVRSWNLRRAPFHPKAVVGKGEGRSCGTGLRVKRAAFRTSCWPGCTRSGRADPPWQCRNPRCRYPRTEAGYRRRSARLRLP